MLTVSSARNVRVNTTARSNTSARRSHDSGTSQPRPHETLSCFVYRPHAQARRPATDSRYLCRMLAESYRNLRISMEPFGMV